LNKNISVFAYGIAIATILSQLAAFAPSPFEDPLMFDRLRNFFSVIWLDVFNSDIIRLEAGNNQRLNILILLGGIFMLIGAIQYTTSNGQEARLIRCLFAVTLLNSITGFIEGVLYAQSIFFRIASAIEWSAFAYGSFAALKAIASTMQLQSIDNNTEAKSNVVEAPKIKRALHWIIDTTLVILTLSSFVPLFDFITGFEDEVGERMALTVFLIIARLIYYLLFEILFRTTPGKLLTQTRVLRDTDAEPDLVNIIGRTLSRFIPFEAFSFFGARGWHDSLSHTKVVNEVSALPSVVYSKGYDNVIDRME